MIHAGPLGQLPERDAAAHAGEPDPRSERSGDLFNGTRSRRGKHEWARHTDWGINAVYAPFSAHN